MSALKFIVIHLAIIWLGDHLAEARKNTPLLVEEDGVRRNMRPAGKRSTPLLSFFFYSYRSHILIAIAWEYEMNAH